MTKTVKLGRLEDGAQKASLTLGDDQGKKLPPTLVEKALGMALSKLDETSRLKYAIKDSLTAGVVVTEVESNSPAARKNILPGEVILEINQEGGPGAVGCRERNAGSEGRREEIGAVARLDARGEVRFVALDL